MTHCSNRWIAVSVLYAITLGVAASLGCTSSEHLPPPKNNVVPPVLGVTFDLNGFGNSMLTVVLQNDGPVVLEDVIVNGAYSLRDDAKMAIPDTLDIGEEFGWIDSSYFDEDRIVYGRQTVYVDVVTSLGTSRRWNRSE